MAIEKLRPIINDLNRPFWTAAEAGQLQLPYCALTGRFFWPPGPFSPFAFPGEMSWRGAERTGVLNAIVIYRRSFQKAFEAVMPYGVGLVSLTAGPRMQVHIPNPDGPEAPRAGDGVELYFASAIVAGPKIPMARLAKHYL
jgi:uncharacterized OB-fold protein